MIGRDYTALGVDQFTPTVVELWQIIYVRAYDFIHSDGNDSGKLQLIK